MRSIIFHWRLLSLAILASQALGCTGDDTQPILADVGPAPDRWVARTDGVASHDASSDWTVAADTQVPPVDTQVPPTDAQMPPGDTQVPPVDTQVPPTDAQVPPTDSQLPPADSLAQADASGVAPSFPGHQPGKIYLGYGVDNASCPAGSTVATEETFTGAIRMHRYYQGSISQTSTEVSRFKSALSSGRLAWVSFKGKPYTWKEIAAGKADAVLKAKAVAYQGIPGPGLITFHHEPSGDGVAADYVAAWQRILDVWQAAGGTGTLTPCPILNGFFQGYPNGGKGYTDAQMADWMPDALLKRFRVIGYDGYDAGSYVSLGIPVARTVRKWREWLLRRQAVINDGKLRHLAMGETGVFFGKANPAISSWPTSGEGEFPQGYPGWHTVWSRLVGYTSGDASYVAVNYYNSIINTRANADWSLRARRPTTSSADLACDSGNAQPPPGPGVADPTRVQQFKASLQSSYAADVSQWGP